MMSELMPCPFCGSEARVDYNFGRDPWVQCTNIEACGATDGAVWETEDEAIKHWNRRAPVSTPQQSAQRASVDTPKLRELAQAWSDAATECWPSRTLEGWDALIAHINAWGSTGTDAPADPMDWPIPCDITTGACTIRKGCKLRTVVTRMESLQRMATAALPKLSPEERQANWEALKALAAPSPAPQGEQA
jgi:hypothetical protein